MSTTAEPQPMRELRTSQYLGYAGGDAANNLTFSMASMFLLLYYTDVVGIAAGAAGAILLVVRVFQAFTDLFAGQVVDRTNTRWGRFRPFFVFGGLPLMVLGVAIFSVPRGFSGGAALAYAAITYAVFGLTYSLVNIPFGSLASAMTQLPSERAKLSAARSIGSAVAIIALSFVVSPLIESSPDLQRSLTTVMVVLAVVGFALYFFLFATARETVQRDTTPVTLKDTIGQIRRNRPLVLLCASALCVLTGMFVVQTLQVYYARDVLRSANYVIVLTVVNTGGMFVTAPLVPRIVRAWGKRRGYVVAGSVAVVGGVGIALSPPSVPALAVVSFFVYGFGLAVLQSLMWALQADTVEYGEWKSRTRTEGSNYAALSFTRKVGQGFGGGLAAFGIGAGGYIAGSLTQTPVALDTIRVLTGAAPALFVGIGVLIMLAYPLTEQRFQTIVGDLAARRAGHAVPAGEPSEA
ncbi:glycoside-pentoside-hexuronide (GPH):cation symporter [Georgenia sp. SYP-B2076]|uniref:glycoside-pentoside-hexuronide (GPH):cation symporter n=1 Tax=Georgenia sp. SYP-B2076 TaxID=2495881 RepID=UPI0013DEC9B4|nr:glycoside-pentoside-hexuronide (GPH):cation symporter [Georgenia sp. SYP-B2076]